MFYNQWPNNIAQKNLAIDKSSHQWILSIDADERVTPELAAEIKDERKGPKADAYSVPRHGFYLDRWITTQGGILTARSGSSEGTKGGGGIDPHDTVIVSGEVKYLKGDLIHYSFKDIAHHINTMNSLLR